MKKTVLEAKKQEFAARTQEYDTKEAILLAEELKHDACLNGRDIVGEQAALLNKHGIEKIMASEKKLTKLVAYGMAINAGGLYEHNGKSYFLPLHVTVNSLNKNGSNIKIVGADTYVKAVNISLGNKRLAGFRTEGNVKIEKDENGNVLAIYATNRLTGLDNSHSWNVGLELSGEYRYHKPLSSSNLMNFKKDAKTINKPNTIRHGRFRLTIPKLSNGGSSISIERLVMFLTMAHTNEYLLSADNEDLMLNIDANVSTGNACTSTSSKLFNGEENLFIDFNCVEPVCKCDNTIHSKCIVDINNILKDKFQLYCIPKLLSLDDCIPIVSFSANDRVIRELHRVFSTTNEDCVADILFRYMMYTCNIHIIQ